MAKAGGEITTAWIRYSQAKALSSEYLGDSKFVERELQRGLAAGEIPWRCVRFEAPEQYSGPGCGDPEFWKLGAVRSGRVILNMRGIRTEGDSATRIDGGAAYGTELDRGALIRLRLLPPGDVDAGTSRSTKRVHRLTPTEVAAREEFPPDGIPPDTLSTAKALQRLAKRLKQHDIPASDDTMKRAIGRR